MAPSVLALLLLLLASSSAREQSRWSRQLSTYTADISDWVPLPGPVEQPSSVEVKRQPVAEPRILAEPFPGFARPAAFNQDFRNQPFYQNRPLYLQSVPSVPSAPQNFLNDQGFGQSIRFGLSQPNFPLNQGFVSPQFSFESAPQIKPRPTVPANPIKFESFQKTLPSPQAKPFINQVPKKPAPQGPKFVDGYRLENGSGEKRKPQSLQKLKFDGPKIDAVPNKAKSEREEVQLLYVPVESLNQGQFNFRNPQIQSNLYSQGLPKQNPIKQPFVNDFQRPVKPAEHVNFGQEYFSYNPQIKEFDQVKFSTISTPFPTALPTTPRPSKKLKPHQPPLAVFLSQEAKKGAQVKVGDVLSSLKNANTIAVLDAVNPLNAPKVFIGPSTLTPPENFVKFELPYLSNIENSDNKLKQLPFFVAPLSYRTPDGFAKIPFPSPHVGSVVINSQIRETAPATLTTPLADVIPNSYSPQTQKQEQSQVNQKPTFSYYSTAAPKTNAPIRQSEYYSFEPQTVTSVRPPKEPVDSIITAPPKTGSYFFSNDGQAQQYNPNQYVDYSQEKYVDYSQEQVKNIVKQPEPTTTQPPKTTSKPSSTYSSQLLETHNPYSINQAFHFSTPLDYQTFDEKDNLSAQQFKPLPSSSSTPSPSTTRSTTIKQEVFTDKQSYQQTPPNYAQQNYSPEIQYESEVSNSRFPAYNSNEFTSKNEYNRPETVSTINLATVTSVNPPTENRYVETQGPIQDNYATVNEIPTTAAGASLQSTNPSYNQYETSFISNESKESSTSTTTTTTRRPSARTTRGRGRPRYTSTTPRTDSNESSTKYTATRRPLRERRPVTNRPRYEPNKITTEKPTRKPVDSNESSTKSSTFLSRSRTRGRVQFKPSDSDEGQYNRNKGSGSKEADLAYQRDVLHQNYPVTLMERTSTVDIEAITEPTTKFQSTKNVESGVTYDTENAYTYERASVSQPNINSASNENTFPSRSDIRTEAPYVPHLPSTRNEEYVYHSRSSSAPVEAMSYDESSPDNEDIYAKQTTPIQKDASAEVSFATESVSPVTEQAPSFTVTIRQDSGAQENGDATFLSEEANHEEAEVQTTPSYNRVRVRPGVIKQYHQSTTEASKTKGRKHPVQAITYRPAFDRRRTTMRIEEIGEDLRTKQVHSRPDQEHRHPVYKPDPTTEPSVTSASQEISTKRGQFRRRRPSYTTTSTEASSTRKGPYEVKNRFRGRRPTTEKPAEKPEVQTDAPSTTARNVLHSRYSNRPRLSERYSKKPEPEDQDQEPNYSINRPKFAEPEADQWAADSFKPYNPNDIIDDRKDSTAGLQNDDEGDLDIITAKNEYDDILISVTPATNRLNKKIPDIPPTLEALVEQSKVTKSESPEAMSTFETMLEEVMKSLEEQDEDEYTTNVMKHKGGEIGEIPPERIISSGDNYSKPSTPEEETTTTEPSEESSILSEEDKDRKSRRRGFWKKVKVRPATTETIEAAESQHYVSAVNRLAPPGDKAAHDKTDFHDKPARVTTYKPTFNIKDFSDDSVDELPTIDIPKITEAKPQETTQNILQKETPTEMSPGDLDLGTGSPDPTVTELATTEATSETTNIDRNDGYSFMDYLFGTTGESDESKQSATTRAAEVEPTTELAKVRITTTESNVIPEEITAVPESDDTDAVTEFTELKKSNATEAVTEKSELTETSVRVETSSVSSFMDPASVVSTSMSTEVSHETEICFRGKCIKTSKDLL